MTARDIKLVMEGGYNTVEAIAYTYELIPRTDALYLISILGRNAISSR